MINWRTDPPDANSCNLGARSNQRYCFVISRACGSARRPPPLSAPGVNVLT
jgi:hypothetical protein